MARLSLFVCSLLSFFVAVSHAAPASDSETGSPSVTKRAAAPVSTVCGDIINAGEIIFEAKQAYDCLTSVPFNGAVATRFLKYYNDMIQFQSNLAYLKNPPASYQQPRVDFVGGLAEIQADIDSGKFANEYEFEATLQTLIYSTHDAHVNLIAGILGVFTFGSIYDIASVSLDGTSLPKVYFSDDLKDSQHDGTWQPSAISKINGIDVIDYLDDFAAKNAVGSLEPHADFNQLMTSPAQDIQSIFSTWGGGATFYPGDTLTFLLENGTQVDSEWLAIYNYQSETGALQTGGDFYNFFVLGRYPASYDPQASATSTADAASSSSTSDAPASTTSAYTPTSSSWGNEAYPMNPDIVQPDLGTFGAGFVSGYFLKQSSVAVLSLPSFQEPGSVVDSFSATVTRFLNASKAAGMSKVVIDVQQNYGGDVFLAVDTFKQFFPAQEPFGGSRMRAHYAANAIGDSITGYWDSLDDTFEDWDNFYDDEWQSSTRINADTNQLFDSWSEFYGPHVANGDSFTTTQRYNFSDVLFSTLSTEDFGSDDGFSVYGNGDKPANTTQPYAAKDIIILSDSLCSSACAIFMEMMHHEAGVRTVVAGGRPMYGPMQAPSMSRGAAAYGVTDVLDNRISIAQQLLQGNDDPRANFLPNRTTATDVWISYAEINLRDQVRKGGEIPLHFLYEAATCRIFYTPKTFYNYTALWTYAADAMWNKPELCVKDSTGYSTTNATNKDGPPSSVLPAQKPAATKDPKLGSIIMNMISGDSSVEHTPILDVGNPTKQSELIYEGTACPTGECPTTDYFCLETSLKCDTKSKTPIPGKFCVPFCNPNTGPRTVNTCTNFGSCQPLNRTVPGFSLSSKFVKIPISSGFCNPPAPSCKTAKKPSKFNPDSPLNPGKRSIELF